MKTYHKDLYATASITDLKDGTARLKIRTMGGTLVKNSIHKNRNSAMQAWYRYCR